MNKKRLILILGTILLIWLFPWILYLVITIIGFVIWFMVKNPDTSNYPSEYRAQDDFWDEIDDFQQREEEERAREEERKDRFINGF